ncbi:MAG: tRNA (N(6)-L-threonylcarbamoyladenosine(37)-C(2))-methylthiotransferase [Candidatus Hydrothermarchaeales archaeon]
MKVYFETYGCTMNRGDTEVMKGLVEGSHEIVGDVKDSDIVVLNSCGVIGYTERKILKRISSLDKKVIVAGCLPKIDLESVKDSKVEGILSNKSLALINEAIDSVAKGEEFVNLDSIERPHMLKRRGGFPIAIVPIAEGCLGHCTYCGTRFARGRLESFPMEFIVEEVSGCIPRGYREIQLTAQDTGVYGADIGADLAKLLDRVSRIEGGFRVRVGMMNPRYVLNYLEELIAAFGSEKVYKFLHLPVQSGSDGILEDMERGYSVREFLEIVEAFRKSFPDLTLSTDVIVGYPTEGDDAFRDTYNLVEKIRPDILNITRFSPRPKTRAAKLKDVPDRIKKDRSRALTKLSQKIGFEINKGWIDREVNILVTEEGRGDTLLARTDTYKQVIVKNLGLGEFGRTKIEDATPSYLIGELLDHSTTT